MATLLSLLRSSSMVDCDTLDVDVAKKLGPFEDHTSNQAIAYGELTKTVPGTNNRVHAQLITEAVKTAHELLPDHEGTTLPELAAEVMMVRLSLQFTPYLRGYHHIQTNPLLSHDTAKTVSNAKRIVNLFQHLDPSFLVKKICIKIPSTWEGLEACRILEKEGIATLATTLFCMEQAVLAQKNDCTYIAPYVNELKVHFEPGYVDEHKAFRLCGQAQRYFESHRGVGKTNVLPASLTSIHEVMRLAGANHITISPPLLAELDATPAAAWEGKEEGGTVGYVFKADSKTKEDEKQEAEALEAMMGKLNEKTWKEAFERSLDGHAARKLKQAIDIFSGMQDKLCALAKDEMSRTTT